MIFALLANRIHFPIPVQSDAFKADVKELANVLHVSSHPDHLVTFKACCIVLKEQLSPEAANLQKNNKVNPFALRVSTQA